MTVSGFMPGTGAAAYPFRSLRLSKLAILGSLLIRVRLRPKSKWDTFGFTQICFIVRKGPNKIHRGSANFLAFRLEILTHILYS